MTLYLATKAIEYCSEDFSEHYRGVIIIAEIGRPIPYVFADKDNFSTIYRQTEIAMRSVRTCHKCGGTHQYSLISQSATLKQSNKATLCVKIYINLS